jgi:hypothetical protein
MSDFIETVAQEETDLALHSQLCAQRYQQITNRLTHMDQRFDRIENTLTEIKDVIMDDRRDTYRLYLSWAAVIITTMTGAMGFVISHYVMK